MESTAFKFSVIRDTFAEESNVLTVTELCDIAGVSRSGYYTWLHAEQHRQQREAQDQEAFDKILKAYKFRGYAKGVRGIHMRLLRMGIRMNVKKIRRLMQKAIRTNNTAENLVKREFEEHGPRSVLLTDITYIPLNGSHCYLSTILDACTYQAGSFLCFERIP